MSRRNARIQNLPENKGGLRVVSTGKARDERAVVATGFLAPPEMYEDLAYSLADQGYTTDVPNINDQQGFRGRPNERRLHHYRKCVDLIGQKIVGIGHSYGGVPLMMSAAENPERFQSAHLLHSVGFEELDVEVGLRGVEQYLQLVTGRTHLGFSDCIRMVTGQSIHDGLVRYLQERARELHDMKLIIPEVMETYIRLALAGGVAVSVITGDRDVIVSHRPTVARAGILVGPHNVHVIEGGTHFQPQTDAGGVAALIVAQVRRTDLVGVK